MRSQVWPWSRERNRYCAPMYTVPFSFGLRWIGVFQFQRSFSPARAVGWIRRTSCVLRLTRPMLPPWNSA